MNIFVPSKNRHDSSAFIKMAIDQGVSITLVIEPQDAIKYKFDLPILILPENDKGITNVRNYIKQYATSSGLETYWQVDDDVSGLYHREGTRLIKDTISVLEKAEGVFLSNSVALGALEYRQFAWSATKELILNSFCDVCVFVDVKKTKDISYRQYVEGKEDRDFAMQVIRSKQKTARSTMYAFSAPENGSNKGGLKEIFYDLGKEEICVSRMIEIWGKDICVPITKPNGRKDIKIKWDKINSGQISLF